VSGTSCEAVPRRPVVTHKHVTGVPKRRDRFFSLVVMFKSRHGQLSKRVFPVIFCAIEEPVKCARLFVHAQVRDSQLRRKKVRILKSAGYEK
jgi:hypothetical protein